MKIKILTYCFICIAFQACKSNQVEKATIWSQNIKRKIIEDSNQQLTKVIFDSIRNTTIYFSRDIKLKSYQLRNHFDSSSNRLYRDTLVSIFYSTDQIFELVRELCPGNSRSFEGIRYKGNHFGLAEFRYCDGKIKERGFRYNNKEIGVWTEYDSIGNVIRTTDKGNSERLDKLLSIKYYR